MGKRAFSKSSRDAARTERAAVQQTQKKEASELDRKLDEAIELSFPASDPISIGEAGR